jgi:integrase
MALQKLFEIGGTWIAWVDGRPSLYRFWYDRRSGEIRRRSLKTTDIEEAKRIVAGCALEQKYEDPRDPEQVMLVAVLTHYFENHSDKRRSAHAARRAGELVLQFLESECKFGPEVKVGQFTKGLQAKFAQWSVEKFRHSPSYISRNLSVIAAACRFATKTIVKRMPSGELDELKLLRFMPEICFDVKWLADMTDRPEPKPRDYVPTLEELASLLDTDGSETLRRYDIVALNTWARPEAILDLSVRAQVDFENGLVDLNPPGRKQNKKQRPRIKLTENLRGWLEHWGADRPLSYNSKKISGKKPAQERTAANHIKAQFKRRTFRWMLVRSGLSKLEIDDLFRRARKGESEPLKKALAAAEERGIKRITRYTFRHFMATRIRGLEKIKVDREQRSLWLGHGKRDATSWYESHDPEYLKECSRATSMILEQLDALTRRPLVPLTVKQRKELAGLTVVSGQR